MRINYDIIADVEEMEARYETELEATTAADGSESPDFFGIVVHGPIMTVDSTGDVWPMVVVKDVDGHTACVRVPDEQGDVVDKGMIVDVYGRWLHDEAYIYADVVAPHVICR